MSGQSPEEFVLSLVNAARLLRDGGSDGFVSTLEKLLYAPDPRVKDFIATIEKYRAIEKPTVRDSAAAGYELEKLMYLAFDSILGRDSIQSFESTGPQYDLLVNGESEIWLFVCSHLRIDNKRRGILVEAKATKDKVGDPQVARLCSLLHFNLTNSAALGVFFTLHGVSGLPGKAPEATRVAQLSAAWLRQVTFYIRCNTPIIVLDWSDIKTLGEPGSLVRILARKIKEIEAQSGLDIERFDCLEVTLPKHLEELRVRGAQVVRAAEPPPVAVAPTAAPPAPAPADASAPPNPSKGEPAT